MNQQEWKELLHRSRSYRSYDPSCKVTREELEELVDSARFAPATMNLQPLRYRLVYEPDEVQRVQALTKWAGALKDWHLPPEGHCPPAFIVVCHDTEIASAAPGFLKDTGMVCQTILLSAAVMGLGGCTLGAFSEQDMSAALSLPESIKPLLVLAIGKPDETVVVTEVEAGEKTTYYRDEHNIHYVPKRKLKDILL